MSLPNIGLCTIVHRDGYKGLRGLLTSLGLAFLACTASEISLADSKLPRASPQHSNFVPHNAPDSILECVPGFLKMLLFMCQYVCMCVCVCVSTIQGHFNQWHDIDHV